MLPGLLVQILPFTLLEKVLLLLSIIQNIVYHYE